MKASYFETLMIAAALGACSGAGTTPATPTASSQPAPTAAAQEDSIEDDGDRPAPPPSPGAAHKAFAHTLQSAWAERDLAKLMAVYAPSARIGMAGPGGWTETPPAKTKAQFEALMKAFPDSRITPWRIISAGERAVVEWTFTGTNEGELMGEKATQKPVGVRGASFLLFAKDGKVLRENRYMDLMAIQGQLGIAVKGGKVRPVEAAPTADLEVVVATRGEEPKSVSLLKRYYQLTQFRDYQAIAALLAPDAVIRNNREAQDMTKADLVKLQPAADKAFVDEGSVVKACINAGLIGACEYEWTATQKRSAMGIPSTGKRGTIHEADVAEVKDGQLVRVNGYGSRLEWFITFGALNPTPAKPATSSTPTK